MKKIFAGVVLLWSMIFAVQPVVAGSALFQCRQIQWLQFASHQHEGIFITIKAADKYYKIKLDGADAYSKTVKLAEMLKACREVTLHFNGAGTAQDKGIVYSHFIMVK